jgi:hypothetical protein
MSIELKISPQPGFLHVGATGEFSLAEAKRAFTEMLEAMAQHQLGKVLLDGRGLAGNPEFMDRFHYGEYAAQTLAKYIARGGFPATQLAYVLVVPILDPGKFGETVAVNRGMNIRVFDNPDDALGWLGIAPAHKSDEGVGR